MSLLSLDNVCVNYGGIQAARGINLNVKQGELVSLLGANGAGKTTVLRACCGLVPVASGAIFYRDKNISSLPTFAIVSKGLALVPEGRALFSRMTVEENLEMGAFQRRDVTAIKADRAHMYALFPRLFERRGQKAGTLSGGEQQMLAIGRALMSRPAMLLLDEPSMGLAPLMVQKIFEILRQISADGVTILLVEQNAQLALLISSRGYVMEGGNIALEGDAAALLRKPEVRYAYLGE